MLEHGVVDMSSLCIRSTIHMWEVLHIDTGQIPTLKVINKFKNICPHQKFNGLFDSIFSILFCGIIAGLGNY